MARLTILEYPDPRLRICAQSVRTFDADLGILIADLFETMYASRAIGLAATQVDVHKRVIVVDVSGVAAAPLALVNPRIVSRDTIGRVEERCLSVPGIAETVRRATRIRVVAEDATGARSEREVDGLLAVCIQHEIDHLDGRLFVDRLSYFRRLRIRRTLARSSSAGDRLVARA